MVSFPYYSHIFRDSYGSGMGIVWEAYHKGVPLLEVPENPTDYSLMKPLANFLSATIFFLLCYNNQAPSTRSLLFGFENGCRLNMIETGVWKWIYNMVVFWVYPPKTSFFPWKGDRFKRESSFSQFNHHFSGAILWQTGSVHWIATWCFQTFFILTLTWGDDPIWPVFFKGVETTN